MNIRSIGTKPEYWGALAKIEALMAAKAGTVDEYVPRNSRKLCV